MEKMRLAERQKTIPDSDTGFRVTSLKYLIEIRVSTKSFMLETLAFSKGEIFIEIMLPVYCRVYLCILRPRLGRMCKSEPRKRRD